MSLQDSLDAYRAQSEGRMSDESRAILQNSIGELIASGQAARALKVGDPAPDFSLPDPDGALVSLTDLLAGRPLVLTFYRGVWCPLCNIDLQALEAAAAGIRALGAGLVAISPQTAVNSRKSQRDNGLSFPILSDAGNEIANRFGLRFVLNDKLRQLYKSYGVDLVKANGESSLTLPMPARYVIGADGVIAYADVCPDAGRRPDPSELLPTLQRLRVGADA